MTVEVLGTVLGTAIQGQIVGGAVTPCIKSELDALQDLNSTQQGSEVNISGISLNDTVSEERKRKKGFSPPSSLNWCSLKMSIQQTCSKPPPPPSHLFLPSQKQAYMIASGAICIIYILCAIVLFMGVREQEG